MNNRKLFGTVLLILLFILILASKSVFSFNVEVVESPRIPSVLVEGEEYNYVSNLTIDEIKVHSISSFANVTLFKNRTPISSTRVFNKDIDSRNSTFEYLFSPEEKGDYMFQMRFQIGTDHYDIEENFTVMTKKDFLTYLEKVDETKLGLANSTESNLDESDSVQDENVTTDNATDVVVYEEDSEPFEISLSEKYEYEYGPVLIIGNFSLEDKRYDSGTVELDIYSKRTGRKTDCSFDFNKSRMFYCELSSNVIEISEYYVEINIKSNGTDYSMNKSFDLVLKDEEQLTADISYIHEVPLGSLQTFNLHVPSKPFLENFQSSFKITAPDEQVSVYNFREDEGNLSLNLTPEIVGEYMYEISLVSGTDYRTYKGQFYVTSEDVNVTIDMDDIIRHNRGALNITGNINLPSLSHWTNLTTTIFPKPDTPVECDISCVSDCMFQCDLRQNIIFGDYDIVFSGFYGGEEFSKNKTFSVVFDDSEVYFNISYSDSYSVEEMQNFFVVPLLDGALVEDGDLFVEITDSSDISYKIRPQSVTDGYIFNFISLNPGEHILNITYIGDDGIYSEIYNYSVLDSTANTTESSRFSEVNLERDIQSVVEVELLDSFVRSNESYKSIQLPAELNAPVRWLVISKSRDNVSIKDYFSEDLERLNLANYLSRNEYKNFSDIRLHYYDTEKIPYTLDIISEDRMLLSFDKHQNYTDVDIKLNLENLIKVPKEKVVVSEVDADDKETISGVEYSYYETSDFVESITFSVDEIRDTSYLVELLDDEAFFQVDDIVVGSEGSETSFYISFINPDISVMDFDTSYCGIVIDNVTYQMTPVLHKDIYFFSKEMSAGKHQYKVFCGEDYIVSDIFVRPPRKDVRSISANTVSHLRDNRSRMSMSYPVPMNFLDEKWKSIDGRFTPKIENKNLSSLSYVSDKGLFRTELESLSNTYPFKYSKDGLNMSFSFEGLVLYDIANDFYVYFVHPNPDSAYYSQGNKVIYDDIFGGNGEIIFTYKSHELKQEVLVSTNILSSSPEDFGMNPNTTYVMMKSSLDTGDVIIDSQTGTEDIYLRYEDYLDTGVYIKRDYYYEPASHDRKHMYRIVTKENSTDNTYSLFSGIPYDEFLKYETIIFDPTFSIVSNDRDAMSINNNTVLDYYDEDSQYLFFGGNSALDEKYMAGLQFSADVPRNATITDAYITIVSGQNGTSGNMNAYILAENDTTPLAYSSGLGNLSERDYFSNNISWSINSNWETESVYTTPNISLLVQNLVNMEDWDAGNYISFMFLGDEEDEYRSFHGFSSPDDNFAVLTVTFIHEDSNPVVLLDKPDNMGDIPGDAEMAFTAYDSDGIEYCELWGNFTGHWEKNQTVSNVTSGESKSFTPLSLEIGEYEWNVMCNDTMGNSAFNSSNFTFYEVSNESLLDVYSDYDISANYSIFDEVTFYANFSSDGDILTDSECLIEFDGSNETMTYNSSLELFLYSRKFSEPYNTTYTVYCNYSDYEDASNTSWLYLYPIVNASVDKIITRVDGENSLYKIILSAQNMLNITARLDVTDFVSNSFLPSFEILPDQSITVSGAYDGEAYTWTSLITPGEFFNITYNVTTATDDFRITDLYISATSINLD